MLGTLSQWWPWMLEPNDLLAKCGVKLLRRYLVTDFIKRYINERTIIWIHVYIIINIGS